MEKELILITFNTSRGASDLIDILPDFISDQGRSASSGPMTITIFTSENDKKEIAAKLKEANIEFVMFERDACEENFPVEIQGFISKDVDLKENFLLKNLMKNAGDKREKISIQDQLKAAVEEENYELAEILKTKINSMT